MVPRRWDGLVLTSPVTLIDNASVSTFEAVATSASLFGTQQRWGLVPSRSGRSKEGVALRGLKLLRVGMLAPVAGLPCRHAVPKCPGSNSKTTLPLQMSWRGLRLTQIVVEVLHLRTEVIGKKRLSRIRSLALMVEM